MGIAYATLSLTAQIIVMPARLTSASHPVEWFFAQSDLAIRIFPLDHGLWKVPLDLMSAMPVERIPAELSEKVLSDARMRDPYILLASPMLL